MQTLLFATAKEYLQQLHPEYDFVFTIEEVAQLRWALPLEVARQTQSEIVGVACDFAKKRDACRGLSIVILDESCPDLDPFSANGTEIVVH